MMIKFTLPITCSDERCAEALRILCEQKLGVKLHADSDIDNVEGHLSVHHIPNNHQIWCFVYDQDGKHESEALIRDPEIGETKKVVLQDNPRIKRPISFPDSTKLTQIKNITQNEVETEVAKLPRP